MSFPNQLIFLGTGGARFVVFSQKRASGGLWLTLEGTHILIDPGPGSLLQCCNHNPPLDPTELSAIILSHRHLDHCADANVMIEAMTRGGTKKGGTLLAPGDALFHDPVVLMYLRNYLRELDVLKEGHTYHLGPVSLEVGFKLLHPVENYLLTFRTPGFSLVYLSDTRYFPELENIRGDYLLLNLVLMNHIGVDHICKEEAQRIIAAVRPKTALLTHFGTTVLKEGPEKVAKDIAAATGVKTLAGADGMVFPFPD